METSKTSRFGRKAMSLFLSGAMVVAFAPAVAAPLAEAAVAGNSLKATYNMLEKSTHEAAGSQDVPSAEVNLTAVDGYKKTAIPIPRLTEKRSSR